MLVVLPSSAAARLGVKTLRGCLVAIVVRGGLARSPVPGTAELVPPADRELRMDECPRLLPVGARVVVVRDCARSSQPADEAAVCPTSPIVDRNPPGNFRLASPADAPGHGHLGGPVFSYKGNQVPERKLRHQGGRGPSARYLKTLFSNGRGRSASPGSPTGPDTYYYDLPPALRDGEVQLLPAKDHAWISPLVVPEEFRPYDDWVNYGHQASRRRARSPPSRSWYYTRGWCSPKARLSRGSSWSGWAA